MSKWDKLIKRILSLSKEVRFEELKKVLEFYGYEINEPDSLDDYSGQFKLRLPRSLHRSFSFHAKREGISMN